MAQSEELHPAFRRLPTIHVGDPPVLLEAILARVSEEQARLIMGHYLDAVTATMEANLKFVQGVRAVVAAKK